MKKNLLILFLCAFMSIGAFAQTVNVPVVNNSFSLPQPYVSKIQIATAGGSGKTMNVDSIPGWHFELPVTDEGREKMETRIAGVDSLFAYLYNQDGKMRQVCKEIISTNQVSYKVGYYSKGAWGDGNNPTFGLVTYLGSKNSGGTITYFDSIQNNDQSLWSAWTRKSVLFTVSSNSPFNGDSLVLAFRAKTFGTNTRAYLDIDSIILTKISGAPKNVDSVKVTFANANDSLQVSGNGIVTARVYPIDEVSPKVTWNVSDATLATIDPAGFLSADSLKTGKIWVTAISVAAPTKKDSVQITIYKIDPTAINITGVDSVDEGAKTALTASFIPSNTTYKIISWSSSDTAIAKVDGSGTVTGIKKGTATITVTAKYTTVIGTITIKVTKNNVYVPLTIVNPSFELPTDGRKIYWFYGDSITGWSCDDPRKDYNGREDYQAGGMGTNGGQTRAYTNTSTKPIYQAIDKAGTDDAKYLVSYYAGSTWTPPADSLYGLFYLSHYTPGTQTPRDRQYIDSLRVPVTSWGVLLNATLLIPQGTVPAGDSVILEISARAYTISTHLINMNDRDAWMSFDQVSVEKLIAVVHPTSITLSFDTPGDSIRVESTGTMSAVFTPEGTTYKDVTWSVSDAGSIATIDASGILTGVKKGIVTVTATSTDNGVKGTKNIKIYSKPTGISLAAADKISVYPNPSNGSFTLEAKPGSEVAILDVIGKVIYKAKISDDKTNLSISGKGIYLLQVKTNGSVINQKVIVR